MDKFITSCSEALYGSIGNKGPAAIVAAINDGQRFGGKGFQGSKCAKFCDGPGLSTNTTTSSLTA